MREVYPLKEQVNGLKLTRRAREAVVIVSIIIIIIADRRRSITTRTDIKTEHIV